LRAKILELTSDRARMSREGAFNLIRAREYHEDVLRRRRRAFYSEVRRLVRADLATLLAIPTGAARG
jgi:hypothetical protein